METLSLAGDIQSCWFDRRMEVRGTVSKYTKCSISCVFYSFVLCQNRCRLPTLPKRQCTNNGIFGNLERKRTEVVSNKLSFWRLSDPEVTKSDVSKDQRTLNAFICTMSHAESQM